MGRMQRIVLPFAILLLGLSPAIARATIPSVGASLGLAIYMPPDNADNVTMLEVPGSAGQVIPGFMPGFRFTITDDSGRNGVIIEPSVNLISASGTTVTQLQGVASYQFAFTPENP